MKFIETGVHPTPPAGLGGVSFLPCRRSRQWSPPPGGSCGGRGPCGAPKTPGRRAASPPCARTLAPPRPCPRTASPPERHSRVVCPPRDPSSCSARGDSLTTPAELGKGTRQKGRRRAQTGRRGRQAALDPRRWASDLMVHFPAWTEAQTWACGARTRDPEERGQ
eukprot:558511-Prorocentrum_minimum.AAC.4